MDERMGTSKLTILYDERCAVCRRCRDWLVTQPCLVEVQLLPAGSQEAKEKYGSLPWLGAELIAVNDNGDAWIGPAGFLAALWATKRYRSWSYRLSGPTLAPLAERFFWWVSKKRDRWSSWMSADDPECSWCDGARLSGGTW